MPILQVRDIPNDLYEKLSIVAKEDNRSISQETIVLLRDALQQKKERKSKREYILREIDKFNETKKKSSLPDPVDLIREDRDR